MSEKRLPGRTFCCSSRGRAKVTVLDELDEKVLRSDQNQTRQTVKLMFILMVPVVGLMVLALVELSQSFNTFRDTRAAQVAFNDTLAIANVVTAMQVCNGLGHSLPLCNNNIMMIIIIIIIFIKRNFQKEMLKVLHNVGCL